MVAVVAWHVCGILFTKQMWLLVVIYMLLILHSHLVLDRVITLTSGSSIQYMILDLVCIVTLEAL